MDFLFYFFLNPSRRSRGEFAPLLSELFGGLLHTAIKKAHAVWRAAMLCFICALKNAGRQTRPPRLHVKLRSIQEVTVGIIKVMQMCDTQRRLTVTY